MNKWIIIFTCAVAFTACKPGSDSKSGVIDPENINNPHSATGTDPNGKAPVMTFTEEVYDFGTITEGETVKHSFKFSNTGNAELIIASANASCGCTVPEFSKDPVRPGEEGKIDVEFNSSGKPGTNQKQVTVTYNGIPNSKELTIKANVIAKQ